LQLPDGTRVPDPASRFQPQDVHGPSEVIDPSAYQWSDSAWRGRPWSDAVLYELHVGTFTEEGTFLAAIEKLDHLVQLGVTAIEIMPVADFPGKRNWGYDGVLLYALDSSYGRPEDFKAFIEAAHLRGLMVILDVVYNHFGPDGNFIPSYAPQIFTDHHKTPWGDAVNYDSEGSEVVREFIIHNALYWIEEFTSTVCVWMLCMPSKTTAQNTYWTNSRNASEQRRYPAPFICSSKTRIIKHFV
jgi:maltooligosyltrehalose trehalohydrolase